MTHKISWLICLLILTMSSVQGSETDDRLRKEIESGNLEIIRGLFKIEELGGVDRTLSLEQLLDLAVTHNQPQIARFLVEQGAKPGHLLQQCIRTGDTFRVQEIFATIGDAFSGPASLNPLLDLATTENQAEIADVLISRGAEVRGSLLLIRAAAANRPQVATVLIRHGAGVNATDSLGLKAPLHTAAEHGSDDMIRLLLAHGADPDLRLNPKIQYAALMYAVNYRHRGAVRLLLDGGASIDLASASGRTAVHVAVLKHDEEMLSLLLDRGARTDSFDTDLKQSPLYTAVADNQIQMVQMLLAHGPDVNRPSGTGNTPLHAAVGTGNAEMVGVLLRHGADRNARNRAGKTPLQQAQERKNPTIIRLLQQ